ncbi:MAG: hypothetical protein A2808_01685 [Candidatus Moranbacteria bacterium RIFCSPHIGHO2_01_FULL_55_24]|nr:MAG: hypothetical protein A2808_01685 [Candidatus Moranbacteria bacterium RIFCSPHIGHO2_01_FULL_55_24]
MQEFTLTVKNREKVSTKELERSRKEGKIPAVIYGRGTENQLFWLDYLPFSKIFKEAGQSSILSLAQEKGKALNAIIHDVTFDPLSSRFTHVDFFQVRMDEELETHVPLEFIGEAPAVREHGGILVKTLEEVLVSCLPKDLPHTLPIDLSILKTFEDHIQIKDIALPKGVTLLGELETTIALVEPPRTDAEMAALDEKVEADVTKVEGVVKEEVAPEGEAKPE